MRQLEEIVAALPTDQQANRKRVQIESWLDAGMGSCALRNPNVAAMVQTALLRFDGERYRLLAWCIMPNHVHVLIQPLVPLAGIVQSWKSFTGRWAMQHNAELELGVPSGRNLRDYPSISRNASADRTCAVTASTVLGERSSMACSMVSSGWMSRSAR